MSARGLYTGDIRRIIDVNGERMIFVYGDGVKLAVEHAYLPVPHTGLWISPVTELRELAAAAGLRTYDYAKPQEWFDEYLAEHGKVPHGVWWYPDKSDPVDGAYWLMGRFVSVQEMLERVGRYIVQFQLE